MNRNGLLKKMGLLCALAGWLGACTSYSSPTLTVVDVRISEISDDAVVVMFTIDAENDNDVPLPLEEARYSLSLDGKRVFTGFRSPQATLHRNGTQRIQLPAVIPIPEDGPAPTGIHPYRLSGTMVYVTPGEIAELLFDSNVRRPSVQFSDRGTINFDEPAPITPTPTQALDEPPEKTPEEMPSIPDGG